MRQVLDIPLRSVNRRLNHSHKLKPESAGSVVHFLNNTLALSCITHDATTSNLSSSDLKLRLDQRDDQSALDQQRHNRRQHLSRRDERNIHRREIKLRVKILRLQIARVDAFTHFDPRIVS